MFDVTIAFTDGKEATYECRNHVDFYEHGACIQTANGERAFFPYRNFYCISESYRDEE